MSQNLTKIQKYLFFYADKKSSSVSVAILGIQNWSEISSPSHFIIQGGYLERDGEGAEGAGAGQYWAEFIFLKKT